ncbi:hypothetical protein LOK49_LG11G01803 [Camellia lanceoleosa]|uniref:Uncharacterized protein n=1 Tax=Camellia lanceoleosa TaxID=1840588 RepID=A0ACC0G5V0_9ERIC|nr:hypothetical protein LOK49_LG11G01803 [Camellia lanceoleosa]
MGRNKVHAMDDGGLEVNVENVEHVYNVQYNPKNNQPCLSSLQPLVASFICHEFSNDYCYSRCHLSASVFKLKWLKCTILHRISHVGFNSSSVMVDIGRPIYRLLARSIYSTLEAVGSYNNKNGGKATLAKDLACLVNESSNIDDKKPKTPVELKRSLELSIKKSVKEQYINGKFQE